MNGPLIAFFILAAIILVSAVIMVTTKNIMHAALVHLLALSCIGGFYILLQAEFLAAMQILVYAGAVTTMVLFALMLTKARGGFSMAFDNQQKGLAFLTALSFLTILLFILIPEPWSTTQRVVERVRVAGFGRILFSQYVLPFELISVVLLAALIGAIVLATKGDE